MDKETFDQVVDYLTDDRKSVSGSKRKDYTRGNEDVLKNFKNQAEYLGMTPLQSLGVHMEKQFAAVMNYIKTDGQSESEPIIRRIGDVMNYMELLYGLLVDLGYEENVRKTSLDELVKNDEEIEDALKTNDEFMTERWAFPLSEYNYTDFPMDGDYDSMKKKPSTDEWDYFSEEELENFPFGVTNTTEDEFGDLDNYVEKTTGVPELHYAFEEFGTIGDLRHFKIWFEDKNKLVENKVYYIKGKGYHMYLKYEPTSDLCIFEKL